MPPGAGDVLVSILAEAQRVGLIGAGPLPDAIVHAERYLALIPPGPGRLVDLGSGGGLPGLVIATWRDDLQVLLVERRGRAADLLRRGIAAMGAASRVSVVERDAVDIGHDPDWRASADVVTARGLAAPARLSELALPLLRVGGVLIASAVDSGATWPDRLPPELGGGAVTRHDGLIMATCGGPSAVSLPRVRAGSPLF